MIFQLIDNVIVYDSVNCEPFIKFDSLFYVEKSTNDGDKEDEIEDISDSELNNTDIDYVNQDSGRRSKIISKEKISLKLKCEWKGCRFQNTNNLREFSVHIFSHIAEVRIHFEDNDDGKL